jgi:transposase
MLTPQLTAGIDVGSQKNALCCLEASGKRVDKVKFFANNLPGAQAIEAQLAQICQTYQPQRLLIGTEATSFYDFHLLEFLAQSEQLIPFSPALYRINPKLIKHFKKGYPEGHNTDETAAFFIADFLRFGRLPHPFNTKMDYLPLQRLTRFRAHVSRQITVEKNYFLSHLFLKFSAYQQVKPFSDTFGATSQAVIAEFFSVDDIAQLSMEDLIQFVCEKGKNRFPHPEQVVEKIKQVARESYRIRPALAESVSLVLVLSWQNIRALEKTLHETDKAIEHAFAAFPNTLQSVPGLGPVYSAGIYAEIGDIDRFASDAQLAKLAGLAWKRNQSGTFEAQETHLMKAANTHLRYYLVEAANSLKNHNPEYRAYYLKKYQEVRQHQHKRALALTARKLVRLIYALLKKQQLYLSH